MAQQPLATPESPLQRQCVDDAAPILPTIAIGGAFATGRSYPTPLKNSLAFTWWDLKGTAQQP